MKMNLDDPKLTAYALDELEEPEKSAVAHAVGDSPEAQRVVVETRQLARTLRSQYKLELNEEWIAPRRFIAVTDDSFWSKAGPLAIAAVQAKSASDARAKATPNSTEPSTDDYMNFK